MSDYDSHHYFDLNAEAVYDVCENHVDALAQTVEQMIKDLSRPTHR